MNAADSSGSGLTHAPSAALVVVNPSGHRTRVALDPLPFMIGRQPGNHLILRDNRASRIHARVVADNGAYVIEDLNSRHGVWINGSQVKSHTLVGDDRIEFGVEDGYHVIFTVEEAQIQRLMDQLAEPARGATAGAGNLARLRALMEVARALQSSLPIQEVLAAVVDAAMAVTSSERGFLLLRRGDELDVSVARDNHGSPLSKNDLRVPTRLIRRALDQRRELLSMNFDPSEPDSTRPDLSVANLELRSVVCVPLVRVRAGGGDDTMISSVNDTVGLLYLDCRIGVADLSSGNRELVQTLAIEASTILENARLLEEDRGRRKLEEELRIAREIQRGLLPRELPDSGWFRAAGSSVSSHQVGGDYYDVHQISAQSWCAAIADVSGKGVSSALLASWLQGASLLPAEGPEEVRKMLTRINVFLNERTQGEKYATLFYCTLDKDGTLHYANAGHCAPLLVGPGGSLETLEPTSMPLGLLESCVIGVETRRLEPGQKLVAYSDGVTDAENPAGEFFGRKRLREVVRAHAESSSTVLHAAVCDAIEAFTGDAEQNDDVTMLVLEYQAG